MTQIIVTLEDNSPIHLIKKAIGLIKGVSRVVVQKSTENPTYDDGILNNVPSDIRSLIGIAKNLTEETISSDDHLSYILSK